MFRKQSDNRFEKFLAEKGKEFMTIRKNNNKTKDDDGFGCSCNYQEDDYDQETEED
jgi:hypothetical protein